MAASNSTSLRNSPQDFDLDALIVTLLTCRKAGRGPAKSVTIERSTVEKLLVKVREVFMTQPMLLELRAPIKVVGDVHGQFTDLLRLFDYGGLPPDSNYLFLGDYVDRGKQSLETIVLLFAFKLKYPENFFLLRGNHESEMINKFYGFYDEIKRRFKDVKLWKQFNSVFNCMPVAALIEEKIFCCHGGISPELTDLNQIREMQRPCEIPDSGILCDLLWSDPDPDIRGWGESPRKVSYIFGADKLELFLARFDLDLVCRGHEVVEDGYQFFARRRLVTIFSAPNYCNEFDNAAAIMSVDEDLLCSFQVLKPGLSSPNKL